MRAPVALTELVADQGVGRTGVGHPQIGFREPKQGRALFAGEAVLLKETVDPSRPAWRPERRHEARRLNDHAGPLFIGQARLGRQSLQHDRLGGAIKWCDCRAGLLEGEGC